jgi:ATP-dependent helicase Lhr and Lhr-like helicase
VVQDGGVSDALDAFTPATRDWFTGAFAEPTAAQQGAWEAVSAGEHALVVAPTGSGKTLAAFLWALDRLAATPVPQDPTLRCRVLYVSPLKALAVDVQRNLRAPLTGIRQAATRRGLVPPDITVGMRTGDTTAQERRGFARTPPDVLVTTPESLFLILTSAAMRSLRGVETVIVDEVHAVTATKRGAHLALSLERLDDLLGRQVQRIGLSATVRPVEEVSAFLAGGRPVKVVQPPSTKVIDVRVEVPVPDMTAIGESTGEVEGSASGAEQRTSIWPAVEERIGRLVDAHRSTIVFANSRWLAEKLTTRLNEQAAEEPARPDRFPALTPGLSGTTPGAHPIVARAHHGSMSREQRTIVEEELKAGRLPAVVATSSLELGIDMGAVDLVVQVAAPPSVASGLQRIGRAGHQVGAPSVGVVLPKYRGDLVSCAVVAERMRTGSIESLRYPRNPLDVLAQQVVAMVAMRPWTVGELASVVRRAAPYAGLPESALHAVLDMLSGRYPSEEFGELRARIVWDRVTDELHARPGAQRLAVTSGGTIPDRGLFTVVTPGGGRVGELDEEMVYESRPGDTILLGSTAWHVEEITPDRVIVSPAPGQPARMPFWRGDAIGRPLELGRAIGAFVRELSGMDHPTALARCRAAGLDEWAADNLVAYVAEQREATRHVPDDRTVVVERFRDELGDWRLVVHTPFGAQVNGPWALAIAARMRERRGVEVSASGADDGIVLRLPDAVNDQGEDIVPTAEDVLFEPEEIEQLVIGEVNNSALFASRFRECAARSLLLPRRDPTRRSPLWQQRQRSAALMSVASKFEQFPVVLETMRECLQDVYDLGGLRELMTDVRARKVRVVEVTTRAPSPFARTLLSAYLFQFAYDPDAPLAERRTAALALDSTLLAELLGTDTLRELLDPDVLAEIERSLQRLDPERHATTLEQAADLVRWLGDLTTGEAALRGVRAEWLVELERARRLIQVRIAGEQRWIAIEDAGRVRDALGVALPVGVPVAFTEPVPDPLGDLLARFARTRGPFPAAAAAARFGLGVAVATGVLDRMVGAGRLVRGELRPVGADGVAAVGQEYCDADVLRRLRRGSLARLRAEVEPVEPAALGRFLPAWHGITTGPPGRGGRPRAAATPDDVLSVVEQLAGAPIPASALETLVLPARLPGYLPAMLDELTSSGEVIWTGCGNLPGGDGWLTLAPTDVADLLLPDQEPLELTPLHQAVLAALDGGALFFRQLADRARHTLATAADTTGAAAIALDTTRAGSGAGTDRDAAHGGAGAAGARNTLEAARGGSAAGTAARDALDAARGGSGSGAGGSGGPFARAGGVTDGLPDESAVLAALWDLVWAGLVAGDTLAPVRALVTGRGATHRARRPTPRGRYARLRAGSLGSAGAFGGAFSRTGPPTAAGRWGLVPAREPDPTRRAHARAEVFLERHGVLTRGALDTERVTGGFAAVYKVLRAMEESGRCRRGYVVEGLGAAQFAVAGAIDRLRAVSRPPGDPMAIPPAPTTPPAATPSGTTGRTGATGMDGPIGTTDLAGMDGRLADVRGPAFDPLTGYPVDASAPPAVPWSTGRSPDRNGTHDDHQPGDHDGHGDRHGADGTRKPGDRDGTDDITDAADTDADAVSGRSGVGEGHGPDSRYGPPGGAYGARPGYGRYGAGADRYDARTASIPYELPTHSVSVAAGGPVTGAGRPAAGSGYGTAGHYDGYGGYRQDRAERAGRMADRPTAVVLAATDPAQPYGAALRWPDPVGSTRHRPARKAGALAVLVDGSPVLYVERGGRSLLSFTDDDDALHAAAAGLTRAVRDGWLGTLAVERADGETALTSHLADIFREAGFRLTPRGLRLRA